jgi:CheY-like chemotaxis protein
VADHKVEMSAAGRVLRYRDESLLFRSLGSVLASDNAAAETWALILEFGNRRWAFGLPALVGEYELIRRPVDPLLSQFGHVAASSTLDDGRLVLVLSIAGLIRRSDFGAIAKPVQVSNARLRKRVLVVDDSPTIRDVVSEILADHGLEVKLAANGEEAIAMVEALSPDLVLTDLEMPVMDGFELLRRIRARWRQLPVVLLTTRGSAEDRRQATTLGADAYLVKSKFEESTLMDTVKRFFGALG